MPIISTKIALEKLKNNDVVALPTETVYGLAANIESDEALKKIFKVKSRPFFDPLIVHVKNLQQAQKFGDWDAISLKLAKQFWPGPLTLIVPKKKNISELITSGGTTVAFRQPDHPLFQEVLDHLDSPIAAPSANIFGHTSPTNAQHVISEFSNQIDVVDGGSCQTGIESTVVEFDFSSQKLKILRPGLIGKKDFQVFFKREKLEVKIEISQQENSPGFLKNHYQPQSPFFLVYEDLESAPFNQNLTKEIKLELLDFKTQDLTLTEWVLPDDPMMAARELYNQLRVFSETNQPSYILIKKSWQSHDIWQSLMDRLQKASHGSFVFKNQRWNFQKK